MATNIEKLTEDQKAAIINLINLEIDKLGSQTAVANKCGVSDATIDQLRKNKYLAKGDDMWYKVGTTLGWKEKIWNVVEDTLDIKTVVKVLKDAKAKKMFLAIANRAGSGKTAGCKIYMEKNPHNVYYIECEEWNMNQFLNRLCKSLGVDPKPGYPNQMLLEKIIYFFNNRPGTPQLIIDQVNSLKPQVLSILIFLYNGCPEKLSVVITGTPHLQHMIKKGVARDAKYYDEIDSRLGRTYVTLTGTTQSDVRKICAANGFPDAESQDEIWKECVKEIKTVKMKSGAERKIEVVEDMRRLQRIIQKRQLQVEDQAA